MSIAFEKSPAVSVLMSVYNGGRYLSKAIDSILTQSFSDFEFIIINDGSTDSSADIIKSYSDPRIKYVEQGNAGLSTSLARGIGLCHGKYIARMDADDIALQQRLERQFAYLEKNSNCVLLGTACYVIKDDDSIWFTMQHPSSDIEIRWMILFNSPFVHSSVMIRKDALIEVGSYIPDEKFSCTEDYELWSRLIQRFEGANLPEPLLKYRYNPEGISYSNLNIQEQQAMLVSAQNIGRLVGKEMDSKDAEKIRCLLAGNAVAWDFGVEAINETLDLIQEICIEFVKCNSNEYKRNSLVRRRLFTDMIKSRLNAVSFYISNRQYFTALRALLETASHYPQIILNVNFWRNIFFVPKYLANKARRIISR